MPDDRLTAHDLADGLCPLCGAGDRRVKKLTDYDPAEGIAKESEYFRKLSEESPEVPT